VLPLSDYSNCNVIRFKFCYVIVVVLCYVFDV